MKRLFGLAALLLVCAGATKAQLTAPAVPQDGENASAVLVASPVPKTTLFDRVFLTDSIFAPGSASANLLEPIPPTSTLSSSPEPAEPRAASPEPRFVFGVRDDYRWKLMFGVNWIRFRSDIFNASAVGVRTAVAYYTNSWFALEGSVTASYAPQIFQNEHVKLAVYGGGPKIAWRQRQWEPWLHALVGGAHEQPQTVGHGRNAFAVQLGGGADYRFNPRFSGRLQAEYVRTSFFNVSQNNFQLSAGFVIHF